MSTQVISAFKDKLPFVPAIIIEKTLRHDLDDVLQPLLHGYKVAVIDDSNTAETYGNYVYRALQSAFACTHITFDAPPEASDKAASYIAAQSKHCDVLIAVGTGSINDLCKYVSYTTGKSYIAIPTAASMNGYLSSNASIAVEGYKKTLTAHMPIAVLCDMEVIAAAPSRLNKSGMGDSLARSTAQADWLLSHLLLGTTYDASIYEPLLAIEPELLDSARGIAKSDHSAITLLMKTLLISGLGMTVAGGSYPASQAEHMIAHTYGMLKPAKPVPHTFHGEEIGVTTLTVAHLQEELIHKKVRIKQEGFAVSQLKSFFNEKVVQEAAQSFKEKEKRLSLIKISNWNTIQEQLAKVRLEKGCLEKTLKSLEAPTHCTSLGWQEDYYAQAITYARFLRDRFTFLDLE